MSAKVQNTCETFNNWSVPIEILKSFFAANRMAALPLYLFATRHAEFSGTLPERKIPQIAELISRTPSSVKRKLATLVEMGLCTKHKKSYLFVGGDFYTATCGRTKVKSVRLERLDRSYLTTVCYAATISEQGRRIAYKAKKGHPSTKLDWVQNPEIACSYTAAYIERSAQTVSKRRKAAKGFGLLEYKRNFKLKLKGSENVRDDFKSAISSGNTLPSEHLFENNGVFAWVNELPATFSYLLPFKAHSIKSLPLKRMARLRWVNR